MSHLEKNSLSNKDYKMVIPELFKDIKVYHLKFIEQLEIEKHEAIKNQQYELASNIRDQYRKFNTMLEDLMNSND